MTPTPTGSDIVNSMTANFLPPRDDSQAPITNLEESTYETAIAVQTMLSYCCLVYPTVCYSLGEEASVGLEKVCNF